MVPGVAAIAAPVIAMANIILHLRGLRTGNGAPA